MNYKKMLPFLLTVLMILIQGCSALNGSYYLKQQKYDEGEKYFAAEVDKDPTSAQNLYYYGRLLLANDKPEQAIKFLSKAVEIEPNNDNFHFWLGINYWALMDYKKEQQEYLKAIALNNHNVYAHLYLGHNYIDQNKWQPAIDQYNYVLKKDPYDPQALYNKAVALEGLKKYADEKKLLLKYLKYYPDGSIAASAVSKLNNLGNFDWRNFYIGKRKVSLISIKFKKESSIINSKTKPSLQLLGAMLKHSPKLKINIVSYVNGNEKLAYERAKKIQGYILKFYPEVNPNQLPISWFSESEIIKSKNKKTTLNESVNFITDVN